MSLENRAAQFAPFAALSGHQEALAETARITDPRIDLTEEEKLKISSVLRKALDKEINLKIVYYEADKKKDGGIYRTIEATITQIEEYDKTIHLSSGICIRMEDILSVSSIKPY